MKTTTSSCNDSTLDVFIADPETIWDRQKVIHAYRRLGFGAAEYQINNALESTPSDFIDQLIDNALALPITPIDAVNEDNRGLWKRQALTDMYTNDLRDRLTLFWHNHFVTEDDVFLCTSYLYEYYALLQTYALGNFKDFVHDMGITSAMLIYLNGFENTKDSPNENYARELYELITLGENNGYTQKDVVETARALTGYNRMEGGLCNRIGFEPTNFDATDKTIFGVVKNFTYSDVIDNLFEERGDLIARFICRKLYRYFVSPVVSEPIIDEMAIIFLEHNFEIEPVLRTLFKSNHFFNEHVIGIKIKSPIDLMLSFIKETNFSPEGLNSFILNGLHSAVSLNGQDVFNPPDVAGWQGDREWINSNTYTGRINMIENYISSIYFAFNTTGEPELFRNFAMDVAGMAESHGNDPYIISRSIVDRLLPKGFYDPIDYDTAAGVFKSEVPEHYFTEGIWTLKAFSTVPSQVYQLLSYIASLPEFQLT